MSQEYRRPTVATSGLRSWWPVLVPVVWAFAIWGIMRPDAIVARSEVPIGPKWLLYDESDLTALAMRGANAQTDRMPGRLDEPAPCSWDDLAKKLDGPQAPLASRYYLEYPPAALLLFRLGFAIQGERFHVPAALADAHQWEVSFYVPRNEEQGVLWRRLHVAVQFYVAVMAAALIALILILKRGYSPELPGGPLWLLVLPGAVYFALNRFDVLPVLATAVSFACLGRKRIAWAGAALAVGVLLKVYPILFVPIVLRYLGPREGARWLLAFGLVFVAGFVLAFNFLDPQGVVGPYVLQLSRKWTEGNWTLYGVVLPEWLAHSSPARLGILSAAVAGTIVTRPADLASLLRRCALVLIVFNVLAVFWSPQWILWFLPLTFPLANRRPVRTMIVVLDLLNYFSFPILFWLIHGALEHAGQEDLDKTLAWVFVWVRGASWAALAGVLLIDEWRGDAASAFRRNRSALLAAFFEAAKGQGRPRGLLWLSAEPAGEPVFARDAKGVLVGLWPLQVAFRPEEGSDLADVPQASEPRTVTAMFAFEGGEWRTTGRAVFNLTPEQVVKRGEFGE